MYRTGGDEFAIILSGHAFDIRQQLFAKLMIAFNMTYKDDTKKPYERYSASVGMAALHSSKEEAEDLFKRADKVMYTHKQQFKERYGSYR